MFAIAKPTMWANRINYPLEKLVGEKGTFIQGSVSKVTPKCVEVNGVEVPFDYLVLATGSNYNQFARANPISTAFSDKTLESNSKKLIKAKTVLVVGAGKEWTKGWCWWKVEILFFKLILVSRI